MVDNDNKQTNDRSTKQQKQNNTLKMRSRLTVRCVAEGTLSDVFASIHDLLDDGFALQRIEARRPHASEERNAFILRQQHTRACLQRI